MRSGVAESRWRWIWRLSAPCLQTCCQRGLRGWTRRTHIQDYEVSTWIYELVRYTIWTPPLTTPVKKKYYCYSIQYHIQFCHLSIYNRNKDFQEVTLEKEGEVLLRFATVYGFRNIQNLVQKLKRGKSPYHFVEVMACPSGNTEYNPPVFSSSCFNTVIFILRNPTRR